MVGLQKELITAKQTLHGRAEFGELVLGVDIPKRPLQQFVPGVAQTLAGYIVHLNEVRGAAVFRDSRHKNGVMTAVEQDAILRLAEPGSFLGPLAPGDVFAVGDQVHGCARVVSHQGHCHTSPDRVSLPVNVTLFQLDERDRLAQQFRGSLLGKGQSSG